MNGNKLSSARAAIAAGEAISTVSKGFEHGRQAREKAKLDKARGELELKKIASQSAAIEDPESVARNLQSQIDQRDKKDAKRVLYEGLDRWRNTLNPEALNKVIIYKLISISLYLSLNITNSFLKTS